MKYTKEMPLGEFKFWSGGADTAANLTAIEMEAVEEYLDDPYAEPMSETEVNDFFWFERETIAKLLGYSSYDDILTR
jgi:hypothetical protein